MKSRTRLGEKPDTIVLKVKMPILVNTFLLVGVSTLMVYLTDQSIILDKQGGQLCQWFGTTNLLDGSDPKPQPKWLSRFRL